jgi:hypothetical protein
MYWFKAMKIITWFNEKLSRWLQNSSWILAPQRAQTYSVCDERPYFITCQNLQCKVTVIKKLPSVRQQ